MDTIESLIDQITKVEVHYLGGYKVPAIGVTICRSGLRCDWTAETSIDGAIFSQEGDTPLEAVFALRNMIFEAISRQANGAAHFRSRLFAEAQYEPGSST